MVNLFDQHPTPFRQALLAKSSHTLLYYTKKALYQKVKPSATTKKYIPEIAVYRSSLSTHRGILFLAGAAGQNRSRQWRH